MTSRAHLPRRRLGLVVLTVAGTLTALVTSAGAAAPSTPAAASPTVTPLVAPSAPEKMLVIGDSYSSYYGDRHSRYPGWWAMVAFQLGLEPQLDAMGGTGFLSRSSSCEHTRFTSRLDTVRAVAPRILVVEGGRNDWRRCTKDGRVVEATRTEIERAAEGFFDELAAVWDELGRSHDDVLVLTPWGTTKERKGRIIRPIVREAAERHGFSWVETEPLTLDQAPDGVHPNNEGSRFLSEQFLQNSGLADRLPRA
ncbi:MULTISPECIES: SGNH/GDSL hydrolase family protein [Aeromicrobium]|uniref:SGNH/GDSL hydrolase family protein n=1 Tax=Aeromicrobium TaxID=2040 RepID=UPI00257ECB9A|nr:MULTISPECIES: SGNH/GDSL hydrolase family protein [Aeromicrobium]